MSDNQTAVSAAAPAPPTGQRTRSAPQPRQVPPARRTSVDVFEAIKDELRMFMRGSAGYQLLEDALATVEGRPTSDGRQKGMPILSMNHSFGNEPLELCFDIAKIPLDQRQHILVPLINSQVPIVQEALDRLYFLVVELRTMNGLPPIPQPPNAQQQPPAVQPPQQ